MQTLRQDVIYALRLAQRRPALTLVTILTLALGVGGITTTFSLVNALLIRRLPVPDADRVVRVFGATDDRPFDVMSYPNAADFGARATTFESLAIHQQTFVAYGLGDATETAAIEMVTMTGIGMVVGVGGALALARLLRGFLVGVSPFDPITIAVWCSVLAAVALLASYLPARRASGSGAGGATLRRPTCPTGLTCPPALLPFSSSIDTE